MKQSDFRKYVSDKVKEARANGEAWLSWGSERIRITAPKDDEEFFGGDYVVKSRGEVYLGTFGRRKGTGPLLSMTQGFIVQDKAVMAIVAERHPKQPTDR